MIHNVKTATFCRYMNVRVEVVSKKVLKQFYIFRNLSERDVYWTTFPFKKQIRKALFSWLKTSLTNSNDENRLNIFPQCSLTVFYSSLSDFIRINASLQSMITFRRMVGGGNENEILSQFRKREFHELCMWRRTDCKMLKAKVKKQKKC